MHIHHSSRLEAVDAGFHLQIGLCSRHQRSMLSNRRAYPALIQHFQEVPL